MCNKEKEEKMIRFKAFLIENKEKINRITEANTVRNKEGLTVLPKGDPWRNEDVWDKFCLSEDKKQ